MAVVIGTSGDDVLTGTEDADQINGMGGNDTITGLGGDDVALVNPSTDGADQVDLGSGSDAVLVAGMAGQVRLTFTSAEVGNGNPNDSNTMMNQDGGLAVRFQMEDGSDGLTGPVSRYDDEGITFVAGLNQTFDVRDLVSGVRRGDQFGVVTLGTMGADTLGAVLPGQAYYINAGMGDDTVTGGDANDFLVGGAGADSLAGGAGNDSYIGGGGADTITDTGGGDDRVIFDIATGGADAVDTGDGSDVVSVTGAAGQVRVTFTSAEVGNGNPNDSNTMMNQDGGLAVRLQAEDASGTPAGAVSRFDDEGVTFVSGTAGLTFDVRDLVSGAARGDQFDVVVLGTMGADFLVTDPGRSYYFNAGMGNDSVFGGDRNDFLVGGAGDDRLSGGEGDDSYIGSGGADVINEIGNGADRVIANADTDGADTVNLGAGSDVVTINRTAPGQVRLTFTSAEVGNGNANDSNTMANQDGGLAVRLQAENGMDMPTGAVSRYDDEGVTFVGGAGVTFDVRDLVSGTQRGDRFEVVTLGTMGADALTAVQPTRSYYFNAGMGDDTVTGGTANDFLVGGAGRDRLEGGAGDDQSIGGGGNDRFSYSIVGETGSDTILDFQKVDLFVTDAALRDGNGDGRITFGPNSVLDLDGRNGNDTVRFAGLDPASGLRFLGQLPDGNFAYADAATRPTGAIEGRLGNSILNGAAGEQIFFFDTALGLDFGDDRINGFGTEDLLVTTTAISDSDGDGRIDFGGDRTLNLSDGTSVRINNGAVRSLEFDGSVTMNGVTYFVYSRVGSTNTGADDLFM
ncbi:beta strand repeat-containing protein [Sphingomonas lenta]|uniref:Calcium-binding protein n=1 Tax=Sphingomonas lenta TaxID=1141887 RepID=A0A2A2SFV8_9SPHN|nr:calcium-binding protein [Sphingomonas lenta]PAX08146.1 hypothetical protein CKY28_11220 [Sphingomonas lenta]